MKMLMLTSKSVLSSFSVAAAFVMFAACTPKENNARVHDGAIQTGNSEVSKSEMRAANQTLNSENLADSKWAVSSEGTAALEKATQEALNTANWDVLNNIKALMLEGCDDDLQECQNIAYFRKSANSTRVAQRIALGTESLSDRYLMLRLAYALANKTAQPSLDSEYLKLSRARYDELKSKATSTKGQRALTEHIRITTQLLQQLASRPDATADSALLNDFKVWEINNRSADLAQAYDYLMALASRTQVYKQGTNELSKPLVELIASRAQASSSINNRWKKMLNLLPNAETSLDLTPPENNEYFLVYDSIFDGSMQVSEASRIWEGTKKDLTAARSSLKNYVRLQLVLAAFEANGRLQDFLAKRDQFTSGSVLNLAMAEGKSISIFWQETLGRFARLQNFSERYLKSASNDELTLLFSGIPRNVKYLSTYPSMLLVTYYLAKTKFTTELLLSSGPKTIDGAVVLRIFFAGDMAPWFDYGSDYEALREPEVLQSFVMALKLGIFSRAGITAEDFMKLFAEQTLGETHLQTVRRTQRLVRSFDRNPEFQSFLQFCANLERGRLTADRSMTLESLKRYNVHGYPTFSSLPDTSSASFAAAADLYMADRAASTDEFLSTDQSLNQRVRDIIQNVRLEYSPKVRKAELIADLVESETKRSVKSILNNYVKAESDFYSTYLRLHRKTLSCLDRATEEEMKAQEFIVRVFEQHFRDVHAKMTEARLNSNSQLNGAFNFSNDAQLSGAIDQLATYEKGLGFTEATYRFSSVQALLRVREALENGATTALGHEAAKFARGSIALPASIKQMDRAITNLVGVVAYSEDVDVFVNSGMKKLLLGADSMLKWLDQSDFMRGYQERIEVLSALYKAGQIPVEEMASLSLKYVRYTEMNKNWLKSLIRLGKDSRILDRGHLENYFETTDGETLGLLDFAVSRVLMESLPLPLNITNDQKNVILKSRAVFLAEARQYAEKSGELGGTAVPLAADFQKRLSDYYFGRVELEFKQQADLIRAGRDLAKTEKDLPNWIFSTDRALATNLPQAPLVSDAQIRNYRLSLIQFARETKHKMPADLIKGLAN